ncbi:hypothetical protein SDC9_100830 [bioreactor metagenome]|uniref:Uncharacterized protein n=1 Tax=bioreactor metagenome TaxID=1076179 RepID=A0A645ALY7_9ZZZZ
MAAGDNRQTPTLHDHDAKRKPESIAHVRCAAVSLPPCVSACQPSRVNSGQHSVRHRHTSARRAHRTPPGPPHRTTTGDHHGAYDRPQGRPTAHTGDARRLPEGSTSGHGMPEASVRRWGPARCRHPDAGSRARPGPGSGRGGPGRPPPPPGRTRRRRSSAGRRPRPAPRR